MRGYAAIGLCNPKTAVNVGSVLRAAGCYGAAMVAVSGHRLKKSLTDTQKAYRHMPLIACDAPLCTRVFGEQETIEAILSWAAERHGVNPVPMSDLVFTSIEC